MYWLEVSVTTDGEGAEAVADTLRPFAYDGGVVLEQLGDESKIDPEALLPIVTVKIYLPDDEDTPENRHHLEEVIFHLGRLYPIPQPRFLKLIEEDWANAWKAHYQPLRIGNRIHIRPSWLEADLTPSEWQVDDIVITLDPGMAFGTGLHPTTQMCLMALERLVEPGIRFLDVGTGSAILSIAAAKLGAGTLLAVDNDEIAVRTAKDNSINNDLADKIVVREGTLAAVIDRDWDIVVVNILAPAIISMIEQDGLMSYLKRDGRLILSGILEEQVADVEKALKDAEGQIVERLEISDWVALVVASI